ANELSADQDVRIGQISDRFLQELRGGKNPSIDEYLRRYPEIAERLATMLPAMVTVEAAGQPASEGIDQTKQILPEKLGDFRILREIGRGGMGIVYEAEQASLGRRVALKILPRQSLMDSSRVERFQREARAVGQLHHSNIVPVHSVGHHDGVHYYTMQFIHGLGLDQVLSELRKREHGDV
ncbi:MAG: protein kinase, partial [Planctomycetales bacterium]|nr:protein kinase [Planctomycetales bacterium]